MTIGDAIVQSVGILSVTFIIWRIARWLVSKE